MEYKMKNWIYFAVWILVAILMMFAIVYSVKNFNTYTTQIDVKEVDQGIKCATIITHTGAAISCWRE